MPRPVVFDMDGVLVDSEPLYEAAFRAYMASVGRPELGELFPITLGRRPAEFVSELAEPLGRPPGEIGAGLDAAAEALMDAGPRGSPTWSRKSSALAASRLRPRSPSASAPATPSSSAMRRTASAHGEAPG